MKAKKNTITILVIYSGDFICSNYQVPVSEQDEPMMQGKFQPTWESLANYKIPEWFRNVKFGIWAHWGPQCVEGSGDWMARSLYMENSPEYRHHIANYGHPSEFGFKDIIPLWKAEKWDPDKLVAFYKKIGAQYFLLWVTIMIIWTFGIVSINHGTRLIWGLKRYIERMGKSSA